jgi:hypothetical protein
MNCGIQQTKIMKGIIHKIFKFFTKSIIRSFNAKNEYTSYNNKYNIITTLAGRVRVINPNNNPITIVDLKLIFEKKTGV